MPLAWADVGYVRGIHVALNEMLRARVRGRGRVGSSTPTARASAATRAAGPSTRWVEPLVPGNAAAPFHPNARGMQAFGPIVAAASTAP